MNSEDAVDVLFELLWQAQQFKDALIFDILTGGFDDVHP